MNIKIYFAIDESIKNKEQLLKKFLKCLARLYGGFTLYNTYGGWVDKKGKLIMEYSYMIEVYTHNKMEKVLLTILKWGLKKFNQESIMYVEGRKIRFVSK